MYFKKLSDNAILPTRSHDVDGGVDLFSTQYATLKGMMRAEGSSCTFKFDTQVGVFIPRGMVGQIWDKSGRGDKLIKVFGGVIDCGYTGPIKIRMLNMGIEDWEVKPGMALAQLIIVKCDLTLPNWSAEEVVTERGDRGFTSSDLSK